MALASSPNTLYRILTYLFPIEACYLYADLFFVTEQVPNRNSAVSLSEKKDRFGYPIARIDWKLSQEDLDSITAFNEVALNALASRGTRIVFRKTKDRIGETLTSAAHHMGTARMAADARSGVVDRDLKVWVDTSPLRRRFSHLRQCKSGLTISAWQSGSRIGWRHPS
jgi:hypothetical protein